ncbi:2'-5' RNA ligase family protein [Segetibacter koreensis]|uniref:2'-5' RNA ligase family protein n=1 Tax=Segetibacter koreensis TaxID=398037 RepID=UPI0003A0C1E3|nr:2'-5' RNA ligase family protein [Segetibacter koreensis]
MKYFIGIVPPEDIYTTVVSIQKKFGDNRLEPHITLRAPVTVIEETKWIEAIEHICANFSPFEIKLPTTGNFGKRVLFIDVSSNGLKELYNALMPAIELFEQPEINKKENTNYHPHLTLGRSWCGFSKQDFIQMKELANEFLSQKKISFIAHSVRVYHKPSASGRYEAKKDIALSGTAVI